MQMVGVRVAAVSAMSILSLAVPAMPVQASHMSCSGGTPVFQPGVGGIKVAADTSPVWQGVCLWLFNGNGSTSAFLSVKFGIEDKNPATLGNQVVFGTCTSEVGDCQALLFGTGIELGSSVACGIGIGVCYGGGGGVYINEQGAAPTVPTNTRTGVSFELGAGLDQDDTFLCAGICIDETQVDVGTIHVYLLSFAPVLSIPVCVQAGNFETEDCDTI